MKKTVVIGATTNPDRYAFIAAELLVHYGHEVIPVGIRQGMVAGQPILNLRNKPAFSGVDTVTLYIGPQRQEEWYDYIMDLKPVRIIFNPGTENLELEERAKVAGIEVVEGCTLVMLRSGQY